MKLSTFFEILPKKPSGYLLWKYLVFLSKSALRFYHYQLGYLALIILTMLSFG